MGFSLKNFIDCLQSGVIYLPVVIKLTVISFSVGAVFGLLIALIRVNKVPVLAPVFAALVTFYQGVPAMVALLIYNLIFTMKFNDIAAALHLKLTVNDVDPIVVAYVALILMMITCTSEAFRGALQAIEKGQYEAAYSVGLTKIQTLRRIILPQTVSVVMPNLINNFVGCIKATSLVMAVGIVEVMAGSLIPCAATYSFVEGYAAASIIYWVFTILVEHLLKYLEKYTKRYKKGVV